MISSVSIFRALGSLSVCLVLFPSCRSVGLTQAGFLSDYAVLQEDKDQRARQSFVREAPWPGSRKVYVEPIQLALEPSSLDSVSEGQLAILREHYPQYVAQGLGAEFELVQSPVPDAFVVRTALTEVDTTFHYVNWLTALVLWPVDTGGATLEVEILDPGTQNQLAAMVNADRGTLLNGIQAMTRIGHACQAVEETGLWVAQTLRAGQGLTGASE